MKAASRNTETICEANLKECRKTIPCQHTLTVKYKENGNVISCEMMKAPDIVKAYRSRGLPVPEHFAMYDSDSEEEEHIPGAKCALCNKKAKECACGLAYFPCSDVTELLERIASNGDVEIKIIGSKRKRQDETPSEELQKGCPRFIDYEVGDTCRETDPCQHTVTLRDPQTGEVIISELWSAPSIADGYRERNLPVPKHFV